MSGKIARKKVKFIGNGYELGCEQWTEYVENQNKYLAIRHAR